MAFAAVDDLDAVSGPGPVGSVRGADPVRTPQNVDRAGTEAARPSARFASSPFHIIPYT